MQEINISAEELIASQPPILPAMFPSLISGGSSIEDSDGNLSSFLNFSSVSNELELPDLWMRHSQGITIVLCIAYSTVFFLGLLGNSLVVSVVLRSPRMRTVTNYFIVNLAFADILVVIFCLPATLLGNIFVPWMLGWFMCKTVSYLQGVSVSASINTLVAISIDRFVAICYPFKCQMTPRSARQIIVVIWLFSLFITLPWALYFQLLPIDLSTPHVKLCVESWPQEESETLYFLIANLVLCYLLPLTVISMCYIGIWIKVCKRSIPGETKGTNADVVMQRSKLKVVKMMVIVVVLFFLSWLPLYVIFTLVKLGGPVEENSRQEKILMVLAPIAQWLGASNSCINPVLYTFFNKKFRRGFLAIVKSRSCCGTLRYETANKGTRNTVLRSTFKSRCDTQCEYITSAQV